MNIIITGIPTYADDLISVLTAQGATVLHYDQKARYVSRLADDHVALIIVDDQADDWQFWVTTPKTSPATRRIPVAFVTDDSTVAEQARTNGADHIVSRADLIAQIPSLLASARSLTDETRAALLDQCDDPLPPDAQAAIQRFNDGEYYAQHDLFEALWMHDPRPVRDLYRAILQVGIAYYQIERGNWNGAHKMLVRSVQWLAILPDVCQSVDIGALKADAAAVRAELERVGASGIATFDKTLLKPVQYATKL